MVPIGLVTPRQLCNVTRTTKSDATEALEARKSLGKEKVALAIEAELASAIFDTPSTRLPTEAELPSKLFSVWRTSEPIGEVCWRRDFPVIFAALSTATAEVACWRIFPVLRKSDATAAVL